MDHGHCHGHLLTRTGLLGAFLGGMLCLVPCTALAEHIASAPVAAAALPAPNPDLNGATVEEVVDFGSDTDSAAVAKSDYEFEPDSSGALVLLPALALGLIATQVSWRKRAL